MKKANKNKNTNDVQLLNDNSSFLVREDYRTLCTNTTFSFTSPGAKCIAVTSANRSEGKSTNAVNIAISYAQMGRRVLLIDCDLRLPTIASKLKQKAGNGLSNILVEDCTVSEVVRFSEKLNIYVMFAGTLPPDPTRLLASERMKVLVEKLKTKFDYIILDCPPVNAVVDAALLAPLVDGYLLVIKHNHTEYKDVSSMLTQLNKVNANILGMVYAAAPVAEKKYYSKNKQNYEYRYE